MLNPLIKGGTKGVALIGALKDLLKGYGKEGDKDTFSYGASKSKRQKKKRGSSIQEARALDRGV